MNGQHVRALPAEELAPMVGEALVEAGVCKEPNGVFASESAALLQGSLELVTDVVGQAEEVMEYKVKHSPSMPSLKAYFDWTQRPPQSKKTHMNFQICGTVISMRAFVETSRRHVHANHSEEVVPVGDASPFPFVYTFQRDVTIGLQ